MGNIFTVVPKVTPLKILEVTEGLDYQQVRLYFGDHVEILIPDYLVGKGYIFKVDGVELTAYYGEYVIYDYPYSNVITAEQFREDYSIVKEGL